MPVQLFRLLTTVLLGVVLLIAATATILGTESAPMAAQSTLNATTSATTSATLLLRGTPTPVLRGTATRQVAATREGNALPTMRATASATDTPTPTVDGIRYQIDQRATSQQLPDIALDVRRAVLTADQLILTVAFENLADEPIRFSFITPVEKQRIQLIDSSGTAHPAIALDEAWAAIQPTGGFAVGGANLGTVTFARPIGPGPYRLTGIFDYPPVEFALEQPAADEAAVAVPNGTYRVDATLFSNDEVLEPLRLDVQQVTITDETVTFAVAFVNTGYRRYALRRGPTGMDATLLDTERRQFPPSAVSASLADTITPEEGIAADAAYTGTITFPRPTALNTLRFTFTRYSTLTLHFGRNGLIDSTLATTANGTPPPTPTAQPDIAIYNALRDLLMRQAKALLADDVETFLQGVTPALRPSIEEAFTQLAAMPLATVEITLDPGQDYTVARDNQVAAVAVALRYTFRGVPADNLFVQDFLVDFFRQADDSQVDDSQADGSAENGWQINSITPENNTPFWWNGVVTTYEAPHFLIITRPDAATSMETLAQEVETAYTTVANQGLALEDRYVAYFTGQDESFSTYTGATNPNILGVALSRYRIDTTTIDVVSRAFYINGSNFIDAAQIKERQPTITHELVHLALAQMARPFTPPWLAEGLAVYYAEQETAADRSTEYNAERLPTLDLTELTRLSSLGIHDAASETTSYRYLYSGAVIAYLIEQYGEARVLAFYQSYAAVPMADIVDRLPLYSTPLGQDSTFQALSMEVTENALATNFDLTLTTLDAAVKEWLLAQ